MVPKSFEKYIESKTSFSDSYGNCEKKIIRFLFFATVYGRGEDEEMNEDWEYGDAIGKCEPTTDQEDNDEDAYTDVSDPE